MGLFGWLANRWTPAYEYREYYGNEMEYIAWESTAAGSRRGFLLGFPAGALLTVAVIGGAVMTGLYTTPTPTAASREGQREATAAQATAKELDALRAENQGLKTQVMQVNTASQATTKELDALRAEDQGLKKQVMQVNTAAQSTTKELDALRAENQGLTKQVMQVNTASQATAKELDALRAENQGLKRQVTEVKAAATCPPSQPQALTEARPPAQAVAAPSSQLWPPPAPRGSPQPGAGPSNR
jgi:hypothetical protein